MSTDAQAPQRLRRIWRRIWGRPGLARAALSLGAGAGLAILALNTPIWWLAVALILALRTHVGCVAAGWCAGWVLMPHAAQTFEARGARILHAHPDFWRRLLGQPVICYLDLNRAATMGRVVCALELLAAIAIVTMLVVFLLRRWARRQMGMPS